MLHLQNAHISDICSAFASLPALHNLLLTILKEVTITLRNSDNSLERMIIMYRSKMFIPTRKEVQAEAEALSHQLMIRAGLIRKIASGIYSYLPLGYRVIRNIENIIREEMNNAGAQELLMPALLPAEPYQQTGRWDVYGPLMFRLKDRNERDFCLGPTHEEIFTETVKAEIKSYRQLPINMYQIQTKYRDELRPRFGVMRGREFIMKDAYSFDRNQAGLDESYMKMYDAYVNIFDRCGLDYIIVDADSGSIGGSNSQEFMVKSDVGEDTIVYCNKCGYSANIEKAECKKPDNNDNQEMLEKEKIFTPNVKTVEELKEYLKGKAESIVKTILYKSDEKITAVLVRGDREINEVKLYNLLGCKDLTMADAETVRKATGAEVGFAGPVGLDIEIIADYEVGQMKNFITGSNQTDYHYKNVNIDRDFKVSRFADIRNITASDPCPKCASAIGIAQGIEVGHIFKLGTKYSKALDCTYIDEDGKENLMIMGCYGIGVSRLVAAIIEQNSDENGIIWPLSITPYKVIIVPVVASDNIQFKLAEKIYNKLNECGIETILDDRDERAGVKFKDADLIGIPIRITVGKKAGEDIIELKDRKTGQINEINAEECIEIIEKMIRNL